MTPSSHVPWQDYVPFAEFEDGPGEWLQQEYARQKRLGVRTGQTFVLDSEKDELIQGAAFEEPIDSST